MTGQAPVLDILRDGDIEVVGRIVGSSNNALFVTVTRACPEPEPPIQLSAIYKPTIGERPLDDFPDGTLSRREVAAWHVSEASGWGIVPPTVLREGPFGEGMVQQYIEADPEVDVIALVVDEDPGCAGWPRSMPPSTTPTARAVISCRWTAGDGSSGWTTACASRSYPSCGPCSGRGVANRSRRRRWPDSSGSATRWRAISARRSGRC